MLCNLPLSGFLRKAHQADNAFDFWEKFRMNDIHSLGKPQAGKKVQFEDEDLVNERLRSLGYL